jgi:DNA-binding transcriptional LysR family regulator
VREPGSGTREILERNLAVKGIQFSDFKSSVEVGNMHTIINLLKNDCGISFLYRIAVEPELEAGTLKEIPLKDFQMVHNFDFIWEKGSIYSPRIEAICDELMAAK